MDIPNWIKIGLLIISWDLVRLYLQARVNKWMLKKDFDDIDKALDDVEEAIEEESNDK